MGCRDGAHRTQKSQTSIINNIKHGPRVAGDVEAKRLYAEKSKAMVIRELVREGLATEQDVQRAPRFFVKAAEWMGGAYREGTWRGREDR